MTEENNLRIENIESIKLMKMSKGYQWEIKIYPIPIASMPDESKRLSEVDIDRLQRMNDELERRFNTMKGGQEI